MKLLVTGGAGYIGSVVAAMLVDAGHDVVVLDDLSTGHADAVSERARLIEGSVLDRETTEAALSGREAVLHFAARSIVGESEQNPSLYWHNNVVGSLALLDAMRETGVGRLIFSSTAAVYGDPEAIPIVETSAERPTSAYGASKLAIDQMISSFTRAHNVGAVSLRYFNVVGAHAGRGERHPLETHLVPLALEVAAGRRENIKIFGSDYPTRDGTAIRDYIHVADLAAAHLLALSRIRNGEHLICNLGNGSGYSVREVISACERVTGERIKTIESDRRPGDPGTLVASASRAAAELGWRAQRPKLDEMISDAWELIRPASVVS
jgi:UDP-glucose 4-epimerase